MDISYVDDFSTHTNEEEQMLFQDFDDADESNLVTDENGLFEQFEVEEKEKDAMDGNSFDISQKEEETLENTESVKGLFDDAPDLPTLIEQNELKNRKRRFQPKLDIRAFFIPSEPSEGNNPKKNELWNLFKTLNKLKTKEMYTFVENEKKRRHLNEKIDILINQISKAQESSKTVEEGYNSASPIPWKHSQTASKLKGTQQKDNLEYQKYLLRSEKSKNIRNSLNLLLQNIHKFTQAIYPFNESLEGISRKLDKFSTSTEMLLEYRLLLLQKYKFSHYNEEENEQVNVSEGLEKPSEPIASCDPQQTNIPYSERDAASELFEADHFFEDDFDETIFLDFEEDAGNALEPTNTVQMEKAPLTEINVDPTKEKQVDFDKWTNEDEEEIFTEKQMKAIEEAKRAARQRLKKTLERR